MDVKLKVLVGAGSGQEVRVPGPKFFIGRSEECQLRPRSDLVSRHHCALLVDDTGVLLREFGSKNGTYLNGQRVSGEIEINHGDVLRIGPLEFELIVHSAQTVKRKPRVQSIREAAARTAENSAQTELEVDVAEWLLNTDTEAGNTDTRVIEAPEELTREIAASDADTPPDPDKAAPAEKGEPGKLPVQAKKNSADSGKAAADVLKKFFQRR